MSAAPLSTTTSSDAPAMVPKGLLPNGSAPKSFILSFGKGQFLVPAGCVVSLPKKSNHIASGADLGALLATKAPERWHSYLHPDYLCRLRDGDGNSCVYTTFTIEGAPEEVRFLRFVSAPIAARSFPKWLAELDGNYAIENERQQIRFDVLKWSKDECCPSRAQISPELNKWCNVERGDAAVRSCAIAPSAKKRPKGAQGKDTDRAERTKRTKFVEEEHFIEVGPPGTFHVKVLDGLVHIVLYNVHKKHNSSHEKPQEPSESKEYDDDDDDDAER